ncbi:eukaryotic translation initiation factor 3 subunit J [Atheta coriaria]|uniref:eukaryotic translation initiation factor 3 subunit J n=1 Tax=Dalotia coriaria TaxID=877792 RepID=UPI0031F44EA8
MESWDDDNFEPEVKVIVPTAATNKWEGEDEDDDIKDSWEDEDEEKTKEEPSEKAVQKAKKKSLAERLAEKQKLKIEELERRRAAAENDDDEVSAEEKLRMQKESDLKLALETTFGDAETLSDCPTTLEEFDEYANALIRKIQPLTKSTEFPNFAENLVRDLCATLSSLDIKKIRNTIDNLYLEKQKVEKGDKTKKNKGKGKVKLKVEDSNQYSAYAVDQYDDYDDFM